MPSSFFIASDCRRRIAVWVLIAGAVAVALRVAYPPRYLGYDESWSLVWGREIAHGHLPGYREPFAPTPHPLANAVSAVIALFGGGAGALLLVTLVAFTASLVLILLVGVRRFGPPAGVVAAVVLATRASVVGEFEYGSTDLWFIALLLGALLACAEPAKRRSAPLVWLAFAGLIRPEAWLLSAAYLTYLCWGRPPRDCVVPGLVALSAPLLWAGSDLVITGDPLYSLHGTASLAATLDRPRSEAVALGALPQYLRFLLGGVATALGLIGALLGALLLYERSLVVLAAAALGMLTFLALGLLGLPVLDRYLLVPLIALTLFAGVSVGGWWVLESRSRGRRVWCISAGVALLVLTAGVIGDISGLRAVNTNTRGRAQVQGDFQRILRLPIVARAVANCHSLYVPNYRAEPTAVSTQHLKFLDIHFGPLSGAARGVLVSYASLQAYQYFAVPPLQATLGAAPPRGATLVARNRSWRVDVRC